MFSNKGYKETTMADLVTVTGLSKGAVYHHFKSKEEILQLLMEKETIALSTFLEELSKKYNLYIISNGWPSSFRVLKNKGIDKYFKGIIISSMYTTVKEENLFDIFINKYKEVTPSESLYIDDRNHILQKAKEYGFNLLLMDRYKKYEKTQFEIVNNMNDILKILE